MRRPRRRKENSGQPAGGHDARLERWREFLARNHLKLSRAREQVVEAFFEMQGHIELDALHGRVKRRHPHIGLATVYRAIKLMEEAGIVEARHFNPRTVSYEMALGRGHHDHLICEGCGVVVEFSDADIERIQEEVARSHGFVLVRHRHDLLGLCAACRTEPAPPPA